MALAYVGGNSVTGTGATYSVSLTGLTGGLSSSAAAGDIVVVCFGWGTNAGADASLSMSSSGYTNALPATDYWSDDTREANMAAYYKIMPSTPDTTCIANGPNNAANGGGAVVHVWRFVDQTTPLDVTSPAGATGINGSRPDSPSITPVTPGCIIISCGVGTNATTGTGVFTAPTSFTNAVSVHADGSGSDSVISIASYDGWTSGAYNPAAWTGGTTSTGDGWCAASIALRPAHLHLPPLVQAPPVPYRRRV